MGTFRAEKVERALCGRESSDLLTLMHKAPTTPMCFPALCRDLYFHTAQRRDGKSPLRKKQNKKKTAFCYIICLFFLYLFFSLDDWAFRKLEVVAWATHSYHQVIVPISLSLTHSAKHNCRLVSSEVRKWRRRLELDLCSERERENHRAAETFRW